MDAVLTRFPFWESDTETITLNQGSGFILIIYMVGQCRAGAAVPEGVSILDTPYLRGQLSRVRLRGEHGRQLAPLHEMNEMNDF